MTVFVSISFAIFSPHKYAYCTASIASLLFVFANLPSMAYVLSQYYDMGFDKDEKCFEYFQERE